MSAIPSFVEDVGPKRSGLPALNLTPDSLKYAVTHIFLPVDLPCHKDYNTVAMDISLARAVRAAVHSYGQHVGGASEPQWPRIVRMLDNLQASAQHIDMDEDVVVQMLEMQTEDIVAFLIRCCHTAVIFTKKEKWTLLETFEVLPHKDTVEETAEPLACSYPEYTYEIPNMVFDRDIRRRLADLLCYPNVLTLHVLNPHFSRTKYKISLHERISKIAGCSVDFTPIVKHIRDDCIREFLKGDPWRRSSLWLLIRVTIQVSLDRSALGRVSYKAFMLFFICAIAGDANVTTLSPDLLHLMASKILRRLSKLHSNIPNWLSKTALKTCAGLREILDVRWMGLSTRSSPFQNPSQDELERDTQLLLEHSHEYVSNALANHSHQHSVIPFHPNRRCHGSIGDFLSSDGSFFEEGYRADREATLYDVEHSIEYELDDWVAGVTNVDQACAQLAILMDKYYTTDRSSPEDKSVMMLARIELFIAMDKLVMRQIPILVDYSPEIPTAPLEKLFLRGATSLNRLSRAYQYLSERHLGSNSGWSVFSNEFTPNSFPVRYYGQSQHLQQLRTSIVKDMIAGYDAQQDDQQQCSQAVLLQLFTLPLYAKVLVFELQCPACVRIWRSATAQLLNWFFSFSGDILKEEDLLQQVPAVRQYYVNRGMPRLSVEVHLAHSYGHSKSTPTLRYALLLGDDLQAWDPQKRRDRGSLEFSYPLRFFQCSSCNTLAGYVDGTSHTSNDVLAAQAHCPMDLSLDEFIVFGQLRSGGELQWVNILRGLRSKTLNLRRCHFYFLLAQAVSQVGPLNLNTGKWGWHEELQSPSFCSGLLDELGNLIMGIDSGPMDAMMMRSISLLLTRVLSSSPCEAISEWAIKLLRGVRRKTFSWVKELSYNLAKAPTNKERSDLLLDMALTCRSTFDVSFAAPCKLLQYGEDVSALVSCSLFIDALRPEDDCNQYLKPLLEGDRRLSQTLEGILRDMILTDPSDHGIDLAICSIFPNHKPSAKRWENLPHEGDCWLTCQTRGDVKHLAQTIYLNLLCGELRVDGQRSGGLPRAIRNDPACQQIFRDQGFFVIPSNLPGMDYMTLTAMSRYKIHFSIRGDELVIRAQDNQSSCVILELIPSKILKEDLPPVLLDGKVHWLNSVTKTIEIRPFERLWERFPGDWTVCCVPGRYRAYSDCEVLVDMRSPTWEMVSKCFECLNAPEFFSAGSKTQHNNLLISTSSIDSLKSVPEMRLSAVLPQYGLSFFVNEQGELESSDFKDLVYDEDQCVGTLLNLESILVLRPKDCLPRGLISRRVLIPNGFSRTDGGNKVWIETWGDRSAIPSSEPLYHTYRVDTELGCLVGNGGLISTEFSAKLHAMTSHHRPDPLTDKTGAQAALCILRSAGCGSIMKLKALRGPNYSIEKQYPQIKARYKEIRRRYYWDHTNEEDRPLEVRAAQRATHLFPWHANSALTSEDLGGCNHRNRYYTARPGISGSAPPLTSPSQSDASDLGHRNTLSTPALWRVTLGQLLCDRRAPKLPPRCVLNGDNIKISSDDSSKLHQLFSSLPINRSDSAFRQEYMALLSKSAQCVRNESRTTHEMTMETRINVLGEYHIQCKTKYLDALVAVRQSLAPTNPLQQALHQFGQWPPITADVLLRCLASTSGIIPPQEWKEYLISLALLLLDFQRARRLLRFALDGLEEEFSKELENGGCDGWSPQEYPDWLLVQIQGDILIRPTQAKVAMEMIAPKTGQNTVMQVNMGEGKSSVIIPIVATSVADGKQLARVVVPKALMAQMFELLVSRLGGLVNRPTYHIPFSRSPEDEHGDVIGPLTNNLASLMSRCMAEHGILLVQPEHVVSLKLMCIQEQIPNDKRVSSSLLKPQKSLYEHVMTSLLPNMLLGDSFVGSLFRRLSRPTNRSSWESPARLNQLDERSGNTHGNSDSASKWLSLQVWIDSHVRDILDESDEILRPRFQLIYTIGLEQHMDGYSSRWMITQQILRLVKECAYALSRDYPHLLEYECTSPGSFPHLGIVTSSDIGRRLISLIVEHVMHGRLPDLGFQDVPPELHEAIRSFISNEDVLQLPETARRVEEYAKRSEQRSMWNGLLLLRGLLACNILLFALAERKWRVDYGLRIPSRDSAASPAFTMLAIPYRAKDVPAPNTQFGHPDVTIILTHLSYYYSGLTEEQLRSSFEILLHEDDPFAEYARWIKDCDIKPGRSDSLLPPLGEINLKSSEQWDKVIFPFFARNQASIDLYLSRVVFPKEAKEFPWKLSTSSWDLAERRDKVITGFSGTNDSRWLLPMSIVQQDLDHQEGTNARILEYLLQNENQFYMAIHRNGKRETTHELLHIVAAQRPDIRVLLDVGAQVLDLSNHQVATEWLCITPDALGAIYFNDDEPTILMRSGISVPMSSSPLSQQLHRCVVYLDHAHTRGTDLRLPNGSRAAVTLGSKVTKDSLVQGCMRMRRLGHGHSVMFFAPLEVDLSIRALKKDSGGQVTTADILSWAIHATLIDIERQAPYWAQQGVNHKSRHDAWISFREKSITSDKLSDAWLQRDIKSLEDLYAPCASTNGADTLFTLDSRIQQRCKNFGILSFPSAQMEEEHEREVNRELEREREEELLPPAAEPAEHFLDPDVVAFVKTGIYHGRTFRPIFRSLEERISAALESGVWSPRILATNDFCNTIKRETTQGSMDRYLRPVQWILSRKKSQGHVLILLSPFEADRLMPYIRESEYVHLHVYAPCTSKRVQISDDLKLYTVPPLPSVWTPPWDLIDQLNVFAGQLYLRDHSSYHRLYYFLRPAQKEQRDRTTPHQKIFNLLSGLEQNKTPLTFSGSPLPSVMALLVIRHRQRPFLHTHMGKILQGELLTEKDFDVPQSVVSDRIITTDTKDKPVTVPEVTISLLHTDLECGIWGGGTGPSASLASSKRKLEITEAADTDLEPAQKRLCARR